MMNVNDGRVEPETDLGLALASSSRCMPNTRSSSSGAGVNAASIVDMPFVASDHLSELVWSPHYGLSLKCAEKKPSIFGDAGPSNFVLSPTGSFVPPGAAHLNRENQLQASLARSRATVGAVRPVIGSSHGYGEGASNDVEETKDVRGAPVVDSAQKKEDTPMTDAKKQCSSKSVQFTCIAETAENYTALRSPKTVEFFPMKASDPGPSKSTAELLSVKATQHVEEIVDSTCAGAGREQALGPDVGFDPGLHRMEQFNESDSSASNSTSPDVKHRDMGLGFWGEQESKPDMADSADLYRRKGKEKASSDVEMKNKTSKDENSHESVESCNSGGAFSSGRKRLHFDQQLIVSKRLKTQTTATPVSASILGQDSSFMNWISNMVKGLNKMGDDEPTVSLTLPGPAHRGHDRPISRNDDPGSKSMGFQTIFQSIYSCNSTQRTSNQDSPMSAANISPIARYGENATGSCSQPSSDRNKTVRTLACIDTKDGISPSNSVMSPPELDGVKNYDSETPLEAKVTGNEHRGSLWITRLSSKSPAPVLKSEISTDCTRTLTKMDRSSEVNEFLSNPSLPVEKLNNREAMDALKHIASPDTVEAAAHTTTCFYCGRTGHNMSDCSEIAETERESLMKNISQSEGAEDSSPSLCIRCFQSDHWAISCTARSKFGPQRSKQGATLGNHLSASNRSQLDASSSGDNAFKEKQIDAARSKMDVPRGLFDAVRKLQLSRTDILKWMNSCTSLLHLNGYFLRLRLAKWEGGTGYHVACISVDQGEKLTQGSRKPISVDIGGTRCPVESQYISNQDFLEDELKAWWKSTMASGGKIPSPDNLILKLEEKQKLGF